MTTRARSSLRSVERMTISTGYTPAARSGISVPLAERVLVVGICTASRPAASRGTEATGVTRIRNDGVGMSPPVAAAQRGAVRGQAVVDDDRDLGVVGERAGDVEDDDTGLVGLQQQRLRGHPGREGRGLLRTDGRAGERGGQQQARGESPERAAVARGPARSQEAGHRH